MGFTNTRHRRDFETRRIVLYIIYMVFGPPAGVKCSINSKGGVRVDGAPMQHLSVAGVIVRELTNLQPFSFDLSKETLRFFHKLIEQKRSEIPAKWWPTAVYLIRNHLAHWLKNNKTFKDFRLMEIIKAKKVKHFRYGEMEPVDWYVADGDKIADPNLGVILDPNEIQVLQLGD